MGSPTASVLDIVYIVFFLIMSVCTFYCSWIDPQRDPLYDDDDDNDNEASLSAARRKEIERSVVVTKVIAVGTDENETADDDSDDDGAPDDDTVPAESPQSTLTDRVRAILSSVGGKTRHHNNNNNDSDSEGHVDVELGQKNESCVVRSHDGHPRCARIMRPTNSLDDDDDDGTGAGGDGGCSICLGDFEVGQKIGWASNPECHHGFHQECIVQWLLRHRNCPVCRRDFLRSAPNNGDNDTTNRHRSLRSAPDNGDDGTTTNRHRSELGLF